jgi:hypothetical protein
MMTTLKNLFLAVVAIGALLAAIGDLKPSSAQTARPVQDVSVVNAPTVQAQQAGPWTVGAQLAPGSTVGITGTPTVSISGTPTVNVGSLPAAPLDVRPALPAFPRTWEVNLLDGQGVVMIEGDPGTRAIGLTSVTLTNFAQVSAQVNLSAWGSPVPKPIFLVQAFSTLHVNYPTPMVFSCTDGLSCITVVKGNLVNGASVRVTLNGFAQY